MALFANLIVLKYATQDSRYHLRGFVGFGIRVLRSVDFLEHPSELLAVTICLFFSSD